MLPEFTPEQMRTLVAVVERGMEGNGVNVATLLESAGKSLERFARAAASDQPCAWGTTFDEGPFAPMPHLPKLQLLCRLALVQSEAHFADGRHSEALRSLLNVHRAARHAGADSLLVTAVIQHTIEQQAIRLTARHVLSLDEATRNRHAQALKALPPLHTVREALAGENTLAEWLRHMVLGIQHSPESEQALLDMAQSVLQAQSQSANTATAEAAKSTLKSVEDWKQLAAQARALQLRLDTASAKPWKQFQADMQQMRSDLADANATLRNIIPTVEGTMRKQCETQTLHTMLDAALKLGDGLAAGSLPEFKDAFTGEPLLAEKLDEEIVLTCRDAGRGRPLSLRVAGKAAE